ncbi:heparan-alpha-glucosaminide N-acetyltransferase domain-containing protein [Glutamicibacter sp. NPDC087344]|uniref:heparan-alpha-glucosaminide N-acetyltransferase domain-containing protein n=1 Tax=Glutamicibacter sp. NPDC087344 TaxID=3363994 RepID=UPI00382286EE
MDQTNRPSRLLGVDAARLAAILGMFAAHVFNLYERESQGAYSPTFTGAVASGRASVLFMVLAGVSLTLLVRSMARRGYPNPKIYSALALRASIIAVLGMLIGPANDGIAIILVHYGLLFLLLPLALRLSRVTIWIVSASWLLIMPILWRPLAFAWAGQTLGHNPTFTDLLTPGLLFKDLLVTGYYPLMVWFGYGLLGIAIGRTALALPRTAIRFTAWGTGIAGLTLALGWFATRQFLDQIAATTKIPLSNASTLVLTGRLPRVTMDPFMAESAYLWLPTAHSNSLIFTIHAAACAVAVIGIMQLAVPHLGKLGRFMAGAGRAPLTLYVGHILLLPLLQDFLEPITIWWILCAATAVLGLWLGFSKATGPLEYVVRVLSGADSDPPDNNARSLPR